jgi:trehalose-phosphatase
MQKTLPFFPDGLSRIKAGFFLMKPRLLSLDFDGTLAEIAATPGAAWLPDDTRTVLWGLCLLPKTHLVFLSGRSIPDLKQKIRIPDAIYVGNNGLNFFPPSAGWGLTSLKQWTSRSEEIQKQLEPFVRLWPGVLLENKGPDLSLHYRRLNRKSAKKMVEDALGLIQELPVTAHRGKCVLELKPLGTPGKGEALKRLAGQFLGNITHGTCIHIGDDRPDEDVFRVLRRMGGNTLGLKVGEGPTRAHYRLAGPDEVLRFLKLFLESV